MAFPQGGGGGPAADEGTVSHELGEMALKSGRSPHEYIGQVIQVNKVDYPVDAERAGYVEVYTDLVRAESAGGMLMIEKRVDLSLWLGAGQSGTADAIVYQPKTKTLIVIDLKYGVGERIHARDQAAQTNPQLGLYLLGGLMYGEMFGDVEYVEGIIVQPRLDHISRTGAIPVATLKTFGDDARRAAHTASLCADMKPSAPELAKYLIPGDKQCRWCRAKATCPALAKKVAQEVALDFDDLVTGPEPTAPRENDALVKAYLATSLVEQWVKAVRGEVGSRVARGEKLIGPDGQPYKFVEGGEGRRQWADPVVAEQTLLGQLSPEQAYKPREIITAPAAAKLLDRKASKALWQDVFVPLIQKARGAPQLVQGSDPRPPVTTAASADEFTELGALE